MKTEKQFVFLFLWPGPTVGNFISLLSAWPNEKNYSSFDGPLQPVQTPSVCARGEGKLISYINFNDKNCFCLANIFLHEWSQRRTKFITRDTTVNKLHKHLHS